MNLLEEIQSDAVDESKELSNLLRKTLVLASKLKSEDLKKWVTSELNGYSTIPMPEYRTIMCKSVCNVYGPFGSGIMNMPVTRPMARTEELWDWSRSVNMGSAVRELE